MEGKQREPIRLGEDDLRNAREVWAQLEENFRSLSAIAQRALGQDTGAYAASQEKTESSKEFFIFQPGSAKQIHCNPPGGPCYTMIDPPGITRECTSDELKSCEGTAHLLETMPTFLSE
jgi:hypothetical protein